jgi:hypothetical protein
MLSVIIDGADESLRPTFACLTPAATDGFVREVLVADAAAAPEALATADEAGARLVRAGKRSFSEACAAARQPWLLLLQSGVRLEAGWERVAWRHINGHGDRAGWFRLSIRAAAVSARVEEARANLAAGLLGRLRAEHGLLISRGLFGRAIERTAAAGLPLAVGARSLRGLGARVLVEPKR